MLEQNYQIVLCCFFAYFLGSIPFGFLIAKSKGIDIRAIGSGNIGSTNVGRALGKKWQIIVFFLDALKGILPVFIAKNALNLEGVLLAVIPLSCGILAVVGHNWTIFLNFKGGKGVATTAGAIAVLSPISFICSFITYFVVTKLTRYVSLGSILGTLAASISFFIVHWDEEHSIYLKTFGVLISALVIIRHKENIKRLLKGEEAKIAKS